jgi:hypothetical protein
MENVPPEAGPPPSFASIVIKQTVRITVSVAIASALILAIVLSPMMLLAPVAPSGESGLVRWVYAFLSFALQGLIIGAVLGFISGLISGLIRAFKSSRSVPPPPASSPPAKEPPASPPAEAD